MLTPKRNPDKPNRSGLLVSLGMFMLLALSSCGIGKGGNYGERVANCLVSAKHPDSLFTMPLDSLPSALEIDSTMHYRVRNGMEHKVDSIPASLILGQMECLFGNWYDIPSCALIEQDRDISNIGYSNETSIFVTDLGVDEKGNTVYGGVKHTAKEIERNTDAYINLILEKNRLIEELTIFYALTLSDLIPTQYINNSLELQKSLQQQGFLLDEYGERIKITEEGTYENGEQRQQFEIASLKHIPNNLKQDILRKLYKEFETQRDELKRETQGMIEKYQAHFKACLYTYDEGIEVDNLQAFKDRLYELERETPVETSDGIETPENCFSITPQGQINSSCENVSGNLVISNISGAIVGSYYFSGTFDVGLFLSSQGYPSGLYIINIAATITDNASGNIEQRNQTLKYIKQ